MNDELWPSILHFPTDPPVVHDPTSPPIWLLNLLFGLSGCCWLFAYITAVRRGWLEKVSGAPYIAVGTNVTWDFVYAFVFHIQPVQDIISTLYFIIEAILLVQVFQYGHKDAPSTMSRNSFRMMIVGMVLFGLAAHTAAAWDFADPGGYTGFATTLLTSLSFLLILNRRQSTAGQTMYIAVVKMIGTAAAAAGFAALYPTRMLLWVFFTTMVVIDIVYVVQLYRRFLAEGLSPWRKV